MQHTARQGHGAAWSASHLVPLVFKSLTLLASSTKGIVHLLRDLKLTIGPLEGLSSQLGLISTCTSQMANFVPVA